MAMPFAPPGFGGTTNQNANPASAVGGRSSGDLDFIDGTPMAVLMLVLAAMGVAWAMKVSGFRFVIGVGGK